MTKILKFPNGNHSNRSVATKDEFICIHEVPIIKQALYFLNESMLKNGIKLTEKGFLGRNFVQSFWDAFWGEGEDQIFRPSRELECPEVTRLHYLLSESKYVRKYRNKIMVTAKGRDILEHQSIIKIYQNLFNAGMFGWNWGYEDRYPDYPFIQGSAPVLFQMLIAWRGKTVTPKQLFEKAFGEIDSSDQEAESYVFDPVRCLGVRFFQRFCIPFGILQDQQESRLSWEVTDPFQKTDFFESEFSRIFSLELEL